MELLTSKWRDFIDFCRSPVIPYQKARGPLAAADHSHRAQNCCRPHPPPLPQPRPPHLRFGESGDIEQSHKKLYAALAAEFLGMMLFALYGGEARDSAAAYGNGLALAVLVYATANVSGGHLNPAVTLATIISGHMRWRRGLLYMAAQFLGGIVGACPAAVPAALLMLGFRYQHP
jgi:hypothetical protein